MDNDTKDQPQQHNHSTHQEVKRNVDNPDYYSDYDHADAMDTDPNVNRNTPEQQPLTTAESLGAAIGGGLGVVIGWRIFDKYMYNASPHADASGAVGGAMLMMTLGVAGFISGTFAVHTTAYITHSVKSYLSSYLSPKKQ
jgi:hypothetical protein